MSPIKKKNAQEINIAQTFEKRSRLASHQEERPHIKDAIADEFNSTKSNIDYLINITD